MRKNKNIVLAWIPGFLFLLIGGAGAVQEEKEWMPDFSEREKQMTPEEAMKLLKEAQKLMGSSAELLQNSSRGKALEADRELLKKLEKLLDADKKENPEESENPDSMQKRVMKLVEKLLKNSEKKQKNSLDKIKEIIRRVKTQQQQQQKQQQQQQQQKPEQKQANRPKDPGNPAQKPYDPNRTDPPSKFRSRGDRTGQWGDLPPRVRDAILDSSRDIDEYPPEYQEMIKEYMKRLVEDR